MNQLYVTSFNHIDNLKKDKKDTSWKVSQKKGRMFTLTSARGDSRAKIIIRDRVIQWCFNLPRRYSNFKSEYTKQQSYKIYMK